MHELGARVRFLHENTWRLGVIGGVVTNPDSFIHVICDNGECFDLRDDSTIEQVMTPEVWSREVISQYCLHVARGKVRSVDLARNFILRISGEGQDKVFFAVVDMRLNDHAAPVFAEALRQTTTVEFLRLQAKTIHDLSVQGMEVVARGIADCASLNYIELFGMHNTASDQSFIDILCRNLGASPALKTLEFNGCFQPALDAFQSLCHSRVTELKVYCDFPNRSQSRSVLETELSRFSSLHSISLKYCPSTVVQSALLGLVEHRSIAQILMGGTLCHNSQQSGQLATSLDRFLISRAEEDSPISLEWQMYRGVDSVDSSAIVNCVTRHDVFETLHISDKIDVNAAKNIEILLKRSKTLRKLNLGIDERNRQCGGEVHCRIVDGVRSNQSLHELTIPTESPETILAALEENTTLRALILNQMREAPEDGYDFSGLRRVQGLRTLTLRGKFPAGSVDR